MKLSFPAALGITAACVAVATFQNPVSAANLVLNGDFELSTTKSAFADTNGIGHIDKLVDLSAWTKTCILNCGGVQNQANSHGFAFVVDSQAGTRPNGGFGAFVNTTREQLYFWGPANTVSNSNNGFTGSKNGGKFVAIDGDFGRSTISQAVSGLDPAKTYTLSFEYAGAQQGLNSVDFQGATAQKWIVGGISGSPIDVGPWINPSKGFTPWQDYSTTFTPLSSTIDLSFTAWGNVVNGGEPSGMDSLPPFLLLDNVQILESTPPNPPTPPTPPTPPINPPSNPPTTPVPGPMPLLGAGVAFTMARQLRRRVKISS